LRVDRRARASTTTVFSRTPWLTSRRAELPAGVDHSVEGDRLGLRLLREPHCPGSLELLAVQTGTVALDVGEHRIEIPAGDSAWFEATWPHTYINSSAAAATFTLVVLEPA
jgi:hypothetical protein